MALGFPVVRGCRRRTTEGARPPSADLEDRAYSHWHELRDNATGLLLCRPRGSPAGTWPHTPWWHCVLHDRYEAVNFWSHAVPGVVFALLSAAAALCAVEGGVALAVFGACAATTHLLSALTHVYPDDHVLEKFDHIGIVATIVGTPLTACMARIGGAVPRGMAAIAALLLICAFLRPLPRVLGFVACAAMIVVGYAHVVLDPNLAAQLALYGTGAMFFLNNGGHTRWPWLSDHHLLHYFVTAASAMHVHLIRTLAVSP